MRIILLLFAGVVFFACGENSKPLSLDVLPDSTLVMRYLDRVGKNDFVGEKAFLSSGQTVKYIELKVSDAFRRKFLELFMDSLGLAKESGFTTEVLLPYVHAVDVNGDEINDVIYEGPSGAEPDMTHIFIGRGNGYSRIFTGYQHITSMEFRDNKLSAFTLANPGCCANPQVIEYTYSVSFSRDNPHIKMVDATGYLSSTEQPEKQLRPPVPVTLKKDAALRAEPFVFDRMRHPVWGSEGNVIGIYDAGCEGKAVGTRSDSTGLWFLVRMDKRCLPRKCVFTEFTAQPTYIYGWVSQSDVK